MKKIIRKTSDLMKKREKDKKERNLRKRSMSIGQYTEPSIKTDIEAKEESIEELVNEEGQMIDTNQKHESYPISESYSGSDKEENENMIAEPYINSNISEQKSQSIREGEDNDTEGSVTPTAESSEAFSNELVNNIEYWLRALLGNMYKEEIMDCVVCSDYSSKKVYSEIKKETRQFMKLTILKGSVFVDNLTYKQMKIFLSIIENMDTVKIIIIRKWFEIIKFMEHTTIENIEHDDKILITQSINGKLHEEITKIYGPVRYMHGNVPYVEGIPCIVCKYNGVLSSLNKGKLMYKRNSMANKGTTPFVADAGYESDQLGDASNAPYVDVPQPPSGFRRSEMRSERSGDKSTLFESEDFKFIVIAAIVLVVVYFVLFPLLGATFVNLKALIGWIFSKLFSQKKTVVTGVLGALKGAAGQPVSSLKQWADLFVSWSTVLLLVTAAVRG